MRFNSNGSASRRIILFALLSSIAGTIACITLPKAAAYHELLACSSGCSSYRITEENKRRAESVHVRRGKLKGVFDHLALRFGGAVVNHFDNVESKNNVRIVQHPQPGERPA